MLLEREDPRRGNVQGCLLSGVLCLSFQKQQRKGAGGNGGCLGDLKNTESGSEMWGSGAVATRSFSGNLDWSTS